MVGWISGGGVADEVKQRLEALEAEVAAIKSRAATEAANPTATPGSVARAVAGS